MLLIALCNTCASIYAFYYDWWFYYNVHVIKLLTECIRFSHKNLAFYLLVTKSILTNNVIVFLPLSLSFFRLFSLARPSDQEHLLIDPEMNPESVSSFFSVITGKKSLMQKWEVNIYTVTISTCIALLMNCFHVFLLLMYMYMYNGHHWDHRKCSLCRG